MANELYIIQRQGNGQFAQRKITPVNGQIIGFNPTTGNVEAQTPNSTATTGNIGTVAATGNGTTAAAATLNTAKGVVTSEALTTAAVTNYALTLTNSTVAATSVVQASVSFGTATTGNPVVSRITPAAGSVVITIRNVDASVALNGTIKVSYIVLN